MQEQGMVWCDVVMNKDMIKAGMIGYGTYIRNMIAITTFVFMPVGLKEFLYKKVLRKG